MQTKIDKRLSKERHKQFNFYKNSHKKHQTVSEREFASILDCLGIKYIAQKGFFIGNDNFIIADFYIPKPHRVIFEIDGKNHKYTKDYDMQRSNIINNQRRIKIFRFTNEEVLNQKNKVKEMIEFVLR